MDHLWIIYGSRIMSVMGCLDSWFGTGGFNRQKQQKGMGNEQLAVRIASPKYALGISQYQGISSGFLGLSKLSNTFQPAENRILSGIHNLISWIYMVRRWFLPETSGDGPSINSWCIHDEFLRIPMGWPWKIFQMHWRQLDEKAIIWVNYNDLTATEPWNHG